LLYADYECENSKNIPYGKVNWKKNINFASWKGYEDLRREVLPNKVPYSPDSSTKIDI
jgi:hypothetical protein